MLVHTVLGLAQLDVSVHSLMSALQPCTYALSPGATCQPGLHTHALEPLCQSQSTLTPGQAEPLLQSAMSVHPCVAMLWMGLR